MRSIRVCFRQHGAIVVDNFSEDDYARWAGDVYVIKRGNRMWSIPQTAIKYIELVGDEDE